MILHTGNRTDIPAFYAQWLENRLREGFVLVRNPYQPCSVTRYELDPEVVDGIVFCTKNPEPMLIRHEALSPFRQFWFVTITPYGTDLEPHVPPAADVIRSFRKLSALLGPDAVQWRYDPIIVNDDYPLAFHLDAFARMARELAGSTNVCVISFVDLFEKVCRSCPQIRLVSREDQLTIGAEFVRTAAKYDMIIRTCGEGKLLERTGADCSGCMTVPVLEKAFGIRLDPPHLPKNRRECACVLTGDIGQYHTCGHLCRYCYANSDTETVRSNMRRHDPESPLLIGHLTLDDRVHAAVQKSWIDPQMSFF